MGDAGFFRGTNTDQDNRFADKEKKLMKQMKFEEVLAKKINMSKINLDVVKPWITAKINEILGIEDDVVIEFIMSQLEQKITNPKLMQINITGFLNARCARIFMGELWELLVEADEAEDGIPKSLVEKKMADMKKEGNGEAKIVKEEAQSDWNKRYNKLSLGRYAGPTREKGVRDDRVVTTPPRRRRSRSRSPKRNGRDRSPDRKRDSGRRREEDDREREAESKRREEERLKRHAEQRRREDERRDRRDDDKKRTDDRKKREDKRRRSRSRESPVRRRFTEGGDKKRRASDDSDEENKKKRRSRRDSDNEEKREKKHKKEKKKKERKRSPTPSSSDSE